eukprot:5654342-Pyramimonas_sp.AAC.1
MTRGAEVPGMAFWHDSRSSRRNNQVYRMQELSRGVGTQRTMFSHPCGSSNGCLPTRQVPLWK